MHLNVYFDDRYEPNAGDVTRLVVGIAGVQLLSYLGLSWILG